MVKIGQILKRRKITYYECDESLKNRLHQPSTNYSVILIFILISNSIFWSTTSKAQATKTSDHLLQSKQPYIGWIAQYPVVKQHKIKAKLLRYIGEKIFGKSLQLSISKPVYVIADNPSEMLIFDQTKHTLFKVGKKKVSIPKAIKHKEDYFTSLVDACAIKDGVILFTDSRLNKVFSLSNNGKTLGIFNKDTSLLEQPTGIAFNAVSNEVWVASTKGHKLCVFNLEGNLIKTIGIRGDDTAQFNFPTSICSDQHGDMYVVDAMNFRVQIFDITGKYLSQFGKIGDVSGSFASPKGIATDSYGNIYVVDGLFHVVQIFDRQGNYLYKFGQQGRGKEDFWMPTGISIDKKDNVYVADSYNSRVQIFHLYNGIENEKNNSN